MSPSRRPRPCRPVQRRSRPSARQSSSAAVISGCSRQAPHASRSKIRSPPALRLAPIAPTAATSPRTDTQRPAPAGSAPPGPEKLDAVNLEARCIAGEHEHAARPAGARGANPHFPVVGGNRRAEHVGSLSGRRGEACELQPREVAGGRGRQRASGRLSRRGARASSASALGHATEYVGRAVAARVSRRRDHRLIACQARWQIRNLRSPCTPVGANVRCGFHASPSSTNSWTTPARPDCPLAPMSAIAPDIATADPKPSPALVGADLG